MIVGIPKEQKANEYRVGAKPSMVAALVKAGHRVLVQSDAGEAIGYTNARYMAAGATIASTLEDVYQAEIIVKVKEPQPNEYAYLKEGQILFSFLHLAPDPLQTRQLIEKKVIAIACETVTDDKGRLPLLIPMSEIAGRLSIQVAANYLQMNQGGKGIVLGGVPGVLPAKVTILGGGIAGTEAARIAIGLGSDVTVIDKDIHRLRTLDNQFGARLKTLFVSEYAIEEQVSTSDVVVGAVLIPGKKTPKIISRKMISQMENGSVFIDISIDQGGCSETSRPTTHDNPIYVVDGVTHYCVTNMPGSCARTSTQALTNTTLEYVLKIANKGYKVAFLEDPGLLKGLNLYKGTITNENVANDLQYDYVPAGHLL